MRIRSLKRLVGGAALFLTLLLVGLSARSLALHEELAEVERSQQRLAHLAAEMRQSSDALTDLVRNYAVTGDRTYRERYHEVLDIRSGKRARPEGFSYSDWRNANWGPGQSRRSLLAMVRAERVPRALFAHLARSKARSEELARLELEAMARVDALPPSSPEAVAERVRVISSLHDDRYQRAKREIMDAALRFEHGLRDYGRANTERLQSGQRALMVGMLAILACLLAGLFLVIVYVRRAVLRPLESLAYAAGQISKGDYSARAHVRVHNELGLLGEAFDHMALAIESDVHQRETLHQELERAANTDELTGLFNRRAFMRAAANLLARARAGVPKAAVLMIDVDHFKSINDRFGHAVGDRVLADLGARLREQTRRDDVVGRLGGEEFGVVLPGLSHEEARLAGERVRKAVASSGVAAQEHGTIQYTISVGVAVVDRECLDVDEVLRKADGALYRSKHLGRNRVSIRCEPVGAGDTSSVRNLEAVTAPPSATKS